MDKFLQQAREFIASLSSRQRIIFGSVGAAVLIGIAVFTSGVGRPEYKTLYSGLAAEEAQAVARRLAEKNVPYELTPDGTTLKVAPDQLDKVRLDLAAQGLPRSGRLGFEIFDKPNWAGSDFAEKVNYQRALEGELERTIQTIQSVEAVRVHLVMPRESLFTEREREAKASVVLKLRSLRVEEESVKAITFLVASAVDTLKPENVTVVGADGRPLTSGSTSGFVSAQTLETSLQKKLLATLIPVIGTDSLRATVNVEFDSSTTESTQENYDPQKSVVLTTQQSEDRQGAGTAAGGVPGTASNVPQAAPPGAVPLTKTSEEGQFQKTQSDTYAVSRAIRHNMQPADALKRVATAILIDDAPGHKKRTPEDMKQLEELAKAAVGFDATRGDTLALQNISFQSLPTELPVKAPDWKEKMDTAFERWRNPLRYLGMFLAFVALYVLVIRPMQKPAIAAKTAAVPAQLATAAAAASGAGGGIGASEPAVALAGAPAAKLGVAFTSKGIQDDEMFLESELAQELSATSSDVKRAVILKRHLVEKVKTEPAVAGRLIQNWIRSKGDRY